MKLHIENFAKIANVDIEINGITVIAVKIILVKVQLVKFYIVCILLFII